MGRPEPGSRHADDELKRRAQAHAHYVNGLLYEEKRNRSSALNEFREAAMLRPEDQEMVVKVAQRFVAAGEPQTAIELLKQAVDHPSATSTTYAHLSALELQQDDLEAALEHARRAIELDPTVLDGHESLFLCHLQSDQPAQAERVLVDAEAHGQDDAAFLIELSRLYMMLLLHHPAEREAYGETMLRLLTAAAELPIASDAVRLALADSFAHLREDDRAAELYQELLETMTDSPGARDVVRSKLAEVYLRGKNPAQAREQLEQMLQRDPLNVRVCYLLGSLAYDAGDLEAASDYFRRVLTLRPRFEQAYYDLAGVLLNMDRPDEMGELLERARHQFPENFAMEMLTALRHMRLEEFSKAIGHFTSAELSAQATDPERLTEFFYFQYGAACERAGEHQAAERHLRKALELDPSFAPAQNYLGYMWAEADQNLEEALELIEAAVAADPENAAYLDSLAWVLFKLERPEAALAAILKAVERLEEPDAVVYSHLGDIHARLGQERDAITAWRRAYELEPTDSLLRKLQDAGESISPVENRE